MREIIMNASWLASVVLTLVGLFKLPFKSFKEKHPKWYRATFFLLSLVLVVGGSVIVELYIFEEAILTWTYVSLLISTGFIVFGGYSAYECTGLKNGLNKLFSLITSWLSRYSDKKIAKMIGKVGMEKITQVNEKLNAEKTLEEVVEENAPAEETKLIATLIEETNNNN